MYFRVVDFAVIFARRGKFFADRYHARHLETPRETRNAIRYVLCNQRGHEARRGERLYRDWIDPFSSAYWFDGWKEPVRLRESRQRELLAIEQPTAAPTVWLLTTGWRRWGPLAFDELAGSSSVASASPPSSSRTTVSPMAVRAGRGTARRAFWPRRASR